MLRASHCNVRINQQDAQILTNNLYFSLFCSTCFGRAIRPSSGAPSGKLYHAFGPSYNHVAVRLAFANVPNAWYSLPDGVPDERRISSTPVTCRTKQRKINIICKNLCILLVHLHNRVRLYLLSTYFIYYVTSLFNFFLNTSLFLFIQK